MLFGHQRERRHRTTHRNEVIAFQPPVNGAADPGKHGDELTSLVGVCDRRRIDGRPGLELPQRLTGFLIERDELAIEQTCEQRPPLVANIPAELAVSTSGTFHFACQAGNVSMRPRSDRPVPE